MARRVERRLAAILAVDVVAYSRLVEADEGGTLARVRAHRVDFAEPLIGAYRGRVVKLTGDGALVEFASTVDAVECAVAIQRGMAEREAAEPEARRIRYRIGINLGEIVHEDGDIFGDSVNLAVRLEGLAEPGGICIARDVYKQVRSKLAVGFEPLGEHHVKNIGEPVAVYRVLPGGHATGKTARARPRPGLPRRHWQAAAVALLVAVVVAGWYGVPDLALPPGTDIEAEAEADAAADPDGNVLPAEPSIAVLPFANLSGHTETDYFSDGVTEDLIVGLARSPELLVIASNSSFVYKDQAVDVRKVARELGVRYVLEGSVRTSGDQLRITAQLIDGTTGHHLWADRYDNQGTDALALQDEVATKIVNTLVGELGAIRRAEYERVRANGQTSLSEYDYHLRGHELFWRITKQDNMRAREVWLEGLEQFPNSGLLKVHMGWGYFQVVRSGWSSDPTGDLKRAFDFVQSGLASENLPLLGEFYGEWLRANLYIWHERDFDAAIVAAEKTLALFPGFPGSLATLSRVFLYSGQPEVALRNLDEAFRRNPRPPAHYYRFRGWAYFMQNNYDEAIEWLSQQTSYELTAMRLLAASYAHLGRMDEARAAVGEILEHHPDLSVAGLRELLPYRHPEDLERELSGLRKAGLPDRAAS